MSSRLYDLLDKLDADASNDQMVMTHALAIRGVVNQIRELGESTAAGYLRSSGAMAQTMDLLGAPKP